MTDLSGRMDGDTHLFPVRVYYEDTDAGSIVYYARYLHFLERARTEMMRCLGTAHAQMTADHGVVFAVRRCEVDYLRPAVLDDLLEVRTRITEVGGASLIAKQMVWRGDEKLIQASVRLACITMAGRPARIPAGVARTLGIIVMKHSTSGIEGHGPDGD